VTVRGFIQAGITADLSFALFAMDRFGGFCRSVDRRGFAGAGGAGPPRWGS
jgi:hypothetical protein